MVTIIIPLDGSALAEQALPYGRLLSTLLGAPICLVAVVAQAEVDGLVASEVALQSSLGGTDLVGWERARVAREVLAERAEAYLANHLDALRAAGMQADGIVAIGLPTTELCTAVRSVGEALLVLVPHNYDGNIAEPSTSVTDALVKARIAPVFVVRSATVTLTTESSPLALRKILLAISRPERAQVAIDWAARLARAAGAEIFLLHADLMELHDSSINMDARETMRENLRALAATISGRYGVAVTPLLKGGLADTTIIETAMCNGVDLVVLGTELHGWLRRRLLGSVSDSVRRSAPMPVLIVHEDGRRPMIL